MNPDSPRPPRDEVEMRLTALLMGELPPGQEAALRAQMEADPQLAALYRRLQKAIELLREASAFPEQPAPPTPAQLSSERREKLLAHFKTTAPADVPAPVPALIIRLSKRRKWAWAIPMGIAAALMLLIGWSVLVVTQRTYLSMDTPSPDFSAEAEPPAWSSQPGMIRTYRGYTTNDADGAKTPTDVVRIQIERAQRKSAAATTNPVAPQQFASPPLLVKSGAGTLVLGSSTTDTPATGTLENPPVIAVSGGSLATFSVNASLPKIQATGSLNASGTSASPSSPAPAQDTGRAAQLLTEAQGFYDTGRFELAKKRSEQALNVDRSNLAAQEMEKRVDRKMSDYGVRGYNEARADAIKQVDIAWARPIRRLSSPTEDTYSTPPASTGSNLGIAGNSPDANSFSFGATNINTSPGTLDVNGGNTMTLSGSNTFTGGASISAGTTTFSGTTNFGSTIYSGTTTVNAGNVVLKDLNSPAGANDLIELQVLEPDIKGNTRTPKDIVDASANGAKSDVYSRWDNRAGDDSGKLPFPITPTTPTATPMNRGLGTDTAAGGFDTGVGALPNILQSAEASRRGSIASTDGLARDHQWSLQETAQVEGKNVDRSVLDRQPAPTPTADSKSPIIGRLQFWNDDETSKVDLKTALGEADLAARGAQPNQPVASAGKDTPAAEAVASLPLGAVIPPSLATASPTDAKPATPMEAKNQPEAPAQVIANEDPRIAALTLEVQKAQAEMAEAKLASEPNGGRAKQSGGESISNMAKAEFKKSAAVDGSNTTPRPAAPAEAPVTRVKIRRSITPAATPAPALKNELAKAKEAPAPERDPAPQPRTVAPAALPQPEITTSTKNIREAVAPKPVPIPVATPSAVAKEKSLYHSVDELHFENDKPGAKTAPDSDQSKTDAVRLARQEQPDYYNKTIGPGFRANVERVKQLSVEAQAFYDAGRYEMAKKRSTQILDIDKYNSAARELEERINHKMNDLGLAADKQTTTPPNEGAPTPPKPPTPPPIPQPEVPTSTNAFSTFSLNVSDVSFKLASASLEQGHMPEPATVRSEEFINAFDYRDPEPAGGAPLAFASERARYPFAQNRDLLRLSVKTAAAGRQPGRALNLVLLLDNSGSMERSDRVRILREALRVLCTQLQPQDKLSVVTFARTPRLWADGVAGDKAGEVTARVGEITPQGGTNLAAALDLGYATALRHYQAGSISRVVLITDGAANLGDVNPEALKQKVEANRKQGIALDCFGIGWEDYDDSLLETLSRNGDGRYGFINSPEEAASEFAGQLAGALRVAASDVKVQVEFNPQRVTAYRQVGYAKHQLKKEQFRDNTVDAAEIGAAESGNALYVVEVNPRGEGDLATVRVRFKVPGTSDYREHEWAVPFTSAAIPLDQASPTLRLAGTASAFAEWLVASPYAAEVTPDRLLGLINGIPAHFGADPRPKKLEWMIRQAKSVSGR
jgi:autotransporter-associated beta strand protein